MTQCPLHQTCLQPKFSFGSLRVLCNVMIIPSGNGEHEIKQQFRTRAVLLDGDSIAKIKRS